MSRLREELAALLGVEVGEVAGPKKGSEPDVPSAPVLVGTEAVLHRVRRASAVAFLDIDLHLLAPRLSATEDTLALFVRAGRLVGGRAAAAPSSRVLVQTRVPDHPVLEAVSLGQPAPVLAEEAAVRQMASLPPFVALAIVSGSLAPAYAESLGQTGGRRAGLGVGTRRGPFSRAGPGPRGTVRSRSCRAPAPGTGPAGRGRPGHRLTDRSRRGGGRR